MSDIVERLRGQHADCENAQEAATEITALREKLARVERERDEAHKRMQIIIERERSTINDACSLQARVERLEKALTNAVLAFIAQMDVVMKTPESAERETNNDRD